MFLKVLWLECRESRHLQLPLKWYSKVEFDGHQIEPIRTASFFESTAHQVPQPDHKKPFQSMKEEHLAKKGKTVFNRNLFFKQISCEASFFAISKP